MAKRYIRINWQDKPSTATPLSAAFLNKMDKGIDDIDNAVETLDTNKINNSNIANNLVTTAEGLVLDARQGKVLDDKVTAINSNLAKLGTLNAEVLFSGVQGAVVMSSMIPLLDANLRTITVTNATIGGVRLLTVAEVELLSAWKHTTGFSVLCTDSALNATIAGKYLDIVVSIS